MEADAFSKFVCKQLACFLHICDCNLDTLRKPVLFRYGRHKRIEWYPEPAASGDGLNIAEETPVRIFISRSEVLSRRCRVQSRREARQMQKLLDLGSNSKYLWSLPQVEWLHAKPVTAKDCLVPNTVKDDKPPHTTEMCKAV